jgi:hypothetical protein
MTKAVQQKPRIFVGFDLGHGESCIVQIAASGDDHPKVVPVEGRNSFPTAIAIADGQCFIGWEAVSGISAQEPEEFDICFKCMPTETVNWEINRPKIVLFARECYRQIKKSLPEQEAEVQFLVGCPTGWPDDDIRIYRQAFVDAGLPRVRVERESRAAMIQARDSHLIPAEKLVSSIVVIDMGSSTTDVTHIKDLHVKDVREGHRLGASLIEKYLLKHTLRNHEHQEKWEEYFSKHPAEHQVALYEFRLLKEDYFQSPPHRRSRGIGKIIPFAEDELTVRISQRDINQVMNQPLPELDGHSWLGAFRQMLQGIKADLAQNPEYVLLTGGASRMDYAETICKEVFEIRSDIHATAGSVLKADADPQTAVASGLARLARWEYRCKQFEKEIQESFATEKLYDLVRPKVPSALSTFLKSTLTLAFDKNMPACIDKWRQEEIKAADGLLEAFIQESEAWEKTSEAVKLKNQAASHLLKLTSEQIDDHVNEICKAYHIPQRKLNFSLDVGNVPFVEELKRYLGVKFIRALSIIGGKIVDNFKWMPEQVDALIKWFIRIYGKAIIKVASLSGDVGEQLLPEQDADSLATKLAESIHKQMMEQFDEQLQEVRAWIS